MRRISFVFIITGILAFCSIVYELILAQALSAFLENTVLRYSVTIGLYMFSMGFGAMLAEGKMMRYPVLTLLKTEILLTVLGGFVVIWLYVIDAAWDVRWILAAAAHVFILLIGILTGFEIPLLIAVGRAYGEHSESRLLAFDYAGAVAGTLVFAFVFYRHAGLLASAFFTGSLNALTGISLVAERGQLPSGKQKIFNRYLALQITVLLGTAGCLFFSDKLSGMFTALYLR